MGDEASWSKLFEYRLKIHERYPDIWDLKILRKRFPLMVKPFGMGKRSWILGHRTVTSNEVKEHLPPILYKSMDIDRENFHDFYSLNEIQESFDVIFLFEVIEHLDLEGAFNPEEDI